MRMFLASHLRCCISCGSCDPACIRCTCPLSVPGPWPHTWSTQSCSSRARSAPRAPADHVPSLFKSWPSRDCSAPSSWLAAACASECRWPDHAAGCLARAHACSTAVPGPPTSCDIAGSSPGSASPLAREVMLTVTGRRRAGSLTRGMGAPWRLRPRLGCSHSGTALCAPCTSCACQPYFRSARPLLLGISAAPCCKFPLATCKHKHAYRASAPMRVLSAA
jgi:hypothetical protein